MAGTHTQCEHGAFVRLPAKHSSLIQWIDQKEAIIVVHNEKAEEREKEGDLYHQDIDGRSLKLNHIGAH